MLSMLVSENGGSMPISYFKYPLKTDKLRVGVICFASSSKISTKCVNLLAKNQNVNHLSLPPALSGSCLPDQLMFLKKSVKGRKIGGVSGGTSSFLCRASLHPETLQWISTASAVALMLSHGTAVNKSFLVPLFALQAPPKIISWIRGDYGIWTAFVALLVRLFYFIPGDLELPFIAMLLVIVAPYHAANLRGTQTGILTSLVIAAFLAYQHFSRLGSLQKAFEQGSIIATISLICILCVSGLFLF